MPWWQVLTTGAVGIAAGVLTATVGNATLATFPVLAAFGLPPVVANVSTDLGLITGSISSVYAQRRHLHGQAGRLAMLGILSAVGALGGAVILLRFPATVFKVAAPLLVFLALILVAVQPELTERAKRREQQLQPSENASTAEMSRTRRWVLRASTLGVGVYGGYFGGAQGVMAFAMLDALVREDVHRTNASKVVLVAVANVVSGAVFVAETHVEWLVVAILAGTSWVGGLLGSRWNERLSKRALRRTILVVGVLALAKMVFL